MFCIMHKDIVKWKRLFNENHHQKKICNFLILLWFFITLWNTLTPLFIAEFICFNFVSNTELTNLLNSIVVRYLSESRVSTLKLSNFSMKNSSCHLPPTPGILFSTPAIFKLKTVLLNKRLCTGTFWPTSQFLFSYFCLSELYLFIWTKAFTKGIFFFKSFPPYVVCCLL